MMFAASQGRVGVVECNELETKYQEAIRMLAEWVVAVEQNGSGWDDWDEYYIDASFRPCLNRQDLDNQIYECRKQYE